MFNHVLRIGGTLAVCFFIITCDSLPTWVLIVGAFICASIFIYEMITVEDEINDDSDAQSDTPIADKLARDLAFDRDFNKEL